MVKTFFFGLQSNLGTKTIQILVKIFCFGLQSNSRKASELGAKFLLNCSRILNAFGLGCESIPPCNILQFKCCSNYIKIFVKYLLISNNLATKVNLFKKLICWGSLGGGYPLTTSNYLSVKYLLISNNIGTQSLVVQKSDFFGSHWGVYGGVVPPNEVKLFVC